MKLAVTNATNTAILVAIANGSNRGSVESCVFVSQAVLALAAAEFMFFPVAGMDLYFGFVLNTE